MLRSIIFLACLLVPGILPAVECGNNQKVCGDSCIGLNQVCQPNCGSGTRVCGMECIGFTAPCSPSCYDGAKLCGEVCIPANDHCLTQHWPSCPASGPCCGNGRKEGPEECDYGPDNDNDKADACRTNCRVAHCGDGVKDSVEECDGDGSCLPNCRKNRCGDGWRFGAEECDEGTANSDSTADGCRADCSVARCGDGVKDSREQCDEGIYNNDLIPHACRENCINAHCGDNVVDHKLGEQCDGNLEGFCNECRICQEPRDDLELEFGPPDNQKYMTLCQTSKRRRIIKDKNNDGYIIVTGDHLIIDCKRTLLESPAFLRKNLPEDRDRRENVINRPRAVQNGIGFMVRGDNNTLVNCDASGFEIGIVFEGNNNTLVNSRFCGNDLDIRNVGNNNHGNGNNCDEQHGWNDSLMEGCSQDCN